MMPISTMVLSPDVLQSPRSRRAAPWRACLRGLVISATFVKCMGLATPAHAASAQPLEVDFAEAVHRAVSKSVNAELAAWEVKRAEALALQARAAWLPSLGANAQYTRLDDDRQLGGRVILAANQVSANAQLSVPIVAPKAWVGWGRASDGLDVARAAQRDAQRDAALLAARCFLTVIAQRRVVASAEQALATARAHEEFASSRYRAGVGNRLDAVRAEQERASQESRVRVQRVALERAREALGLAMGEAGPIDAKAEPQLGAVPTLFDALGSVTAREDIAAQSQRVLAAHRSSRDSWTDYLPVLTLVAQPFFQQPSTFTQPETGWQAQCILQVPILEGGARAGASRERDASERQARTKLESMLRAARSEVRVAFEAMVESDGALSSARDAARLAHEALTLAQLAYRAGSTSNIEVVDAERRAVEADITELVAEDASRQARLELVAASGRFPAVIR